MRDMFKRILVPLDGSARAEQVLPFAARLARAAGGSIVLLQVVDTLNRLGVYSVGAAVFLQEVLEKDLADAAAYLSGIATSGEFKGIETRIAVFSGLPASHILDVAQEQDIDLIVMCSHGYTGFKRWTLGSVAQKVARQSAVPVLLVREQNLKLKEQMTHGVRALVALDGSPLAEAALLPVAQLVAVLSAPGRGELHLVQLVDVPTIEEEFDSMLEADFNARQVALEAAGTYLQSVRAKLFQDNLASTNLQITWSVEECRDAADALIQIAETGKGIGTRKASDLIALTTHGRSGLQRWISGSVTERVLNGSTLPMLIVHPQGAEALLLEEQEAKGRDVLSKKEGNHVSTNSRSSGWLRSRCPGHSGRGADCSLGGRIAGLADRDPTSGRLGLAGIAASFSRSASGGAGEDHGGVDRAGLFHAP